MVGPLKHPGRSNNALVGLERSCKLCQDFFTQIGFKILPNSKLFKLLPIFIQEIGKRYHIPLRRSH